MKTLIQYIFIAKVTLIACLVLLGTIGVPFAVIIAEAAINPQINYQGKLAGNDGTTVADGSYEIEFNLYTAASGGSPIWTETRDGADEVDVTKGLFSVMLGEVNALTGIDWNQTLYLGVSIEADAEMTPRKKLGAVPAAFVSDTLDNLDSSQFIRSDTANATNTTNTALILTQNGTGDLLNLFDGSTEVFTVLDGGNVGIGTSSPYAKLSVNGHVVASHFTATSTTATTTLAGGLAVGSGALNVLQNGNVGIGTVSPNEFLVVEKNQNGNTRAVFTNTDSGASASVQMLLSNGSSFSDSVRFSVTGTNFTTFQAFKQDGAVLSAEANLSGGLSIVARGASSDLRLYAGGSADANQHLTILSGGNVGVGTTTPGAKLSVGLGNAIIDGFVKSSYFVGTSTATSTLGGGVDIASGCYAVNGTCLTNGTPSQWTTAGSDIYYNSGEVGIGSSSPYAKLAVVTSSTTDDAINLYGVRSDATLSQSSYAGNVYGGYFKANVISANIAYGVYADASNVSDSNGSYGVYATAGSSGTGVFGTGYIGLRGESNSGVGQAAYLSQANASGYSLYALGGKNYFQGNVGIGSSSPSTALVVSGTTTVQNLVSTSTATSTFGGGINIASGCFAINGACVTGGGGTYGDTDVNAYIHASTTIPKIYTNNTFTGANTFNGALTIGSLTGPLQAQNGIVSATTSIGVAYGGTGLTSAPTYGQLLVGNTSGGYTLTSTSSLGIALSDTTGTLSVARGGTGLTTFGGTNRILYTSIADTLTSSSGFVFDGNNLGIGTTTPGAKLSVGSGDAIIDGFVKSSYFTGTSTATSTFGGGLQTLALNVTGSATSTFAQGINLAAGCFAVNGTCVGSGSGTVNSGTLGQAAFYDANGTAVSGTSTLTIGPNSNVGIGTSSPSSKLDIWFDSNAGQTGLTVRNTNSGSFGSGNLYVGNNLGILGGIEAPSSSFFVSHFASRLGFVTDGVNAGGIDIVSSKSNGDIRLYTGGLAVSNERMRILSSGNVGIGTTTPGAKLSVGGGSAIIDGFVKASYIVSTSTASSTFGGGIGVTGNSSITGTLTGLTGLTSSGSVTFSGLTATRAVCTTTGGLLTSTCTSAGMLASVSDETGTGVLVFGTSPTFTTQLTSPMIVGGTAASSNLTLKSTSGAGTTDYIRFTVGSNGAVEAMRINTIGNIGIGSTSPSTKLVVSGTTTVQNLIATSTATSTFGGAITVGAGHGTSTFAGGLQSTALNVTGSATSTFAQGINLATGCFAVNGTCITGGGSSQWTTAGSDIYYNTGNVGIGSSTPWAKLSVVQTGGGSAPLFMVASSTAGAGTSTAFYINPNGKISMGVDQFTLEQNPNHQLFVNGRTLVATGTAALPGYSFLENNGTGIYMPATRTLGLVAFTQELITLNGNNGRVGVGSTTPSVRLSVGSGDAWIDGLVRASSFVGTSTATSTFGGGINIAAGCFAINGTCVGAGGGSGTVNSGTLGQVAFYDANGTTVSGTSTLTIAGNGNVGIGTTSPGAAFSVVGGSYIGAPQRVFEVIGTSSSSSAGGIYMHAGDGVYGGGPVTLLGGSSSEGNGGSINITAGQGSTFGGVDGSITLTPGTTVGDGKIMLAPTGGNVGIGTTTPGAKLSVGGGNAIIDGFVKSSYFQATSTTATSTFSGGFLAGPGGVFRVLQNGYVGIGTTSPSATFSVGGNALIQFNLSVGGNIDTPGLGRFGSSTYTAVIGDVPNSRALTVSGPGTISAYLGTGAAAGVFNNSSQTVTIGGSASAINANSNGITSAILVNGSNAVTINNATHALIATGTAYFNGNVGIGTTTPYSKLSVNGQVVAANFVGTTSAASTFGGRVAIGTSSPVDLLTLYGASSGDADASVSIDRGGNLTQSRGFGYTFKSNGDFRGGLLQSKTTEDISIWTPSIAALTVTSAGNVGVGSTTPGAKFSVGSGDALIDGFVKSSYFIGTSTATSTLGGGINIASGCFAINGTCVGGGGGSSQWTTAGSDIYYNTGNVGIGTSTPFAKLSVNGDAFVGNLTATSTITSSVINTDSITADSYFLTGGSVYLLSTTAEFPGYKGLFADDGSDNILAAYNSSGNIYSLARATIVLDGSSNTLDISANSTNFSGGNLGIGTSTPGAKLSVGGGNAIIDGFVKSSYFVGTSTATSTFGGGINISSGCYAYNGTCITGGGGSSQWTTAGSDIHYNTGNVGIGTSSPYAKLSVVGQVAAEYFTATSTSATSTFNGPLLAGVGSSYPALSVWSALGGGIGLVGIGTSTPDAPLTVVNNSSNGSSVGFIAANFYSKSTGGAGIALESGFGSGGKYVLRTTSGRFQITNMADNSNPFAIDGDGKVGIGDTTPDEMLTVIGTTTTTNLRVTDLVSCDTIDTDASGNLSCGTDSGGGGGSGVDGVTVTTFTASSTWTKSNYSGLSFTQVITTGGGGGGGGAAGTAGDTATEAAGGGGGGGGTAIEMIPAGSLGSTETVTVGGGGTAGSNVGSDGGAGQTSSFGSHNSATGGGAGDGIATAASVAGFAVAGGTGSGGDINIDGGSGQSGVASGEVAQGGSGGASYWGGGGGGGTVDTSADSVAGTSAVAYGAGGGGGAQTDDNTSPWAAGGAGANGVVVTINYTSSGADLAEWYETMSDVEEGDVVAISTEQTFEYDSKMGLQKSSVLEKAGTGSAVVGVVSTVPFQAMGSDIFSNSTHPKPIALAGRVPVKVSNENGEVKAGDMLTVSSVPGIAMKSTKAGVVIGRTLEDAVCEEDAEVCKVLVMVNTSYTTGSLVKVAMENQGVTVDAIQTSDEMSGVIRKAIFAELLQNKKNFVASTSASEVFTDRVIASLDIVAPYVLTEVLETTNIKIGGEDGTLRFMGNATTTDASDAPIVFDADGNAWFKGVVHAEAIEVTDVRGMNIITQKIEFLDNAVSGLQSDADNESDTGESQDEGISDEEVLRMIEIITDTKMHKLQVAEVIAEKIVSPEIQSLTEMVVAQASSTETLERAFVIENMPLLNGGLSLDAAYNPEIVMGMMGDVVYFGRPYFNSDTAGFAVITKDARRVTVEFDREFIDQPIVNASISFEGEAVEEGDYDALDAYFSKGYQFIITNKNSKGFDIVIDKVAEEDIRFSWTAFAVHGAVTFTSREIIQTTILIDDEIEGEANGEEMTEAESVSDIVSEEEVSSSDEEMGQIFNPDDEETVAEDAPVVPDELAPGTSASDQVAAPSLPDIIQTPEADNEDSVSVTENDSVETDDSEESESSSEDSSDSSSDTDSSDSGGSDSDSPGGDSGATE